MVDYGVCRNLNNLVAPIAVFLYKLKNKLPLELCLAVVIMQYGPNLPEHYAPIGQVPNYLPIPYPPTYYPTTQPPLTMQYGPNLPEHYVPNGQVSKYPPIPYAPTYYPTEHYATHGPVPNYPAESYATTYNPSIQHGDTMPPMHLSDPPRMPADAVRRPIAQPMTSLKYHSLPAAGHPRNSSFQHATTGSAFHSYARAPFTSVPPPLHARNAGADYAPQQARHGAKLPFPIEYREDMEADERAARMHFGSHAEPEAICLTHDTDASEFPEDKYADHWKRCQLLDMISDAYADTMVLPSAPRRTAVVSRENPWASTSKPPGSKSMPSTKKTPSAWHAWLGFKRNRPLMTVKQYEMLYAKLIERRPRDRQEDDAQYQMLVNIDALTIADELVETEKQRKNFRKREAARQLKTEEDARMAEALACPTQRTRRPIVFYTSDGLPNVSHEMQSAQIDADLWVEQGVVTSKSPPLPKHTKKKKKLPP